MYLNHIRTGCWTSAAFRRTMRAFWSIDIRTGMIDLLKAFNLYAEATGEHWSCLQFTNGNPSLYRTTELYLPVLPGQTTLRSLKDSCVTVLTSTERRKFEIRRKEQLCELINYLLRLDSQPPARCVLPTGEDELMEQLHTGKPTNLLLQHATTEVEKARVLNATMALSKALRLKPSFSDDKGALYFQANDGTEDLKVYPFASFFGSDDASFQFSAVPTTAILIRNLGSLARKLTVRKIRHSDETFKRYKAFVGDQPDHMLYKNDVILNLALPGSLASLAELLILHDKENTRTKGPILIGGRYKAGVLEKKSCGIIGGKVEKYSVGVKPSEVRKKLMEVARAEKKRKMASSVADWRKMGMRDHVRGER